MGIHLGLMFINAVTIVLVFLLAKQLYGPIVGLVAAAAFTAMSLLPSIRGIFAHAEYFVIQFSIGGLWMLVKALDEDKPCLILFSGFMLGSGFLMKQHGAAFILFGGLYLILLLDWIQDYQAKHFRLVGLVEIYSENTSCHWAQNAKWPPNSPF
jgi:4-amino-4-deoxy-L-arabinose transferase-like glycosyltransferase